MRAGVSATPWLIRVQVGLLVVAVLLALATIAGAGAQTAVALALLPAGALALELAGAIRHTRSDVDGTGPGWLPAMVAVYVLVVAAGLVTSAWMAFTAWISFTGCFISCDAPDPRLGWSYSALAATLLVYVVLLGVRTLRRRTPRRGVDLACAIALAAWMTSLVVLAFRPI